MDIDYTVLQIKMQGIPLKTKRVLGKKYLLYREMLIFQYSCVCKHGLSNCLALFSQGGDENSSGF